MVSGINTLLHGLFSVPLVTDRWNTLRHGSGWKSLGLESSLIVIGNSNFCL